MIATAGIAPAFAVNSFSYLALAISPWLPLALAFVVGAGFGYLSANAGATTQLQLGVVEEQRGRIMALWSVAFLGTRPFASLVDGVLAERVGVRVAAALLATPVLLAAAILLRSAVATPESEPEPARG